jgi:hypothetical protein
LIPKYKIAVPLCILALPSNPRDFLKALQGNAFKKSLGFA